jgi:hypothetical protein
MSTKQSAYQNIYFMLRLYFVQNKYVSHTINSRPPRGPTPPNGGGTHNLGTYDIGYSLYKKQSHPATVRQATKEKGVIAPIHSLPTHYGRDACLKGLKS